MKFKLDKNNFLLGEDYVILECGTTVSYLETLEDTVYTGAVIALPRGGIDELMSQSR